MPYAKEENMPDPKRPTKEEALPHTMSPPKPLTAEELELEELRGLGRCIDSAMVCADSEEDLRLELNTKYPHEKWTTLRAPVWCGNKLVVMVVRPRNDSDCDDQGA